MKVTLSIILCKLVTLACHTLGKNGTVFPGEFTSKIFKRPLDDIKYPSNVIVVTGSSGKGSTVSMIAHILEKNGKKVVWNNSGSNVRSAIATLILNNTKVFSHKLDCDVLLLEMDERYITGTFKKGTISHMLITNITRDQPARNIHPTVIFEKIMESVDNDMHLILNADDPLLNRAKFLHSGKITTYGVAKTKYDKVPNYAIDYAYCPSCHEKLKYASYHYGHLGLYECPRCSFERGHIDYEAENVDLEKGTFKIGKDKITLNKNVFFAVYYTTLAYTICDILGIGKENILKMINDEQQLSKRGKIWELDGRKIEMLESKNENNLSYLQSLEYIKSKPGKKTVIMGFENVSRRYRYNDLSWLWDINFDLLNDDSIDKIFCIGRFKHDVKTRLDYASIDPKKIVLVEDLNNLINEVTEKSTGDIYTMVCFDMTEIITNLLKEKNNEKEN